MSAPAVSGVIALPNGPDFLAAFYGARRSGAVSVPLAPESGGERLEAGARAHLAALGTEVLSAGAAGPRGGRLRYPDAGALCQIQYTAGSTGNPIRSRADPGQCAGQRPAADRR